jgi:hypothetical protein
MTRCNKKPPALAAGGEFDLRIGEMVGKVNHFRSVDPRSADVPPAAPESGPRSGSCPDLPAGLIEISKVNVQGKLSIFFIWLNQRYRIG